MAKISLREYNREIEGLIEGGQLDEAVAHCQHILKSFSMHLGTYQLLGKAFLEAHRYTDAADIFQRILNATPDDFIAHVGMSIIRDDEGKLDEAIWHMERAFEVQPSNPAIQGELRRLYGRRDGTEPTKIRLSRDALANMYAQGELFNQAIAEIKAVLAEDPDRPDLQVMLARAYFRIGQKVEAAEIAAHLLKKYPYCLDALRILVEVLPGSTRAENTQVYRQRLRLLDPYSSFVTGSVFVSDQVADSAVTLERLEYLIEKQPTTPQPTWASSLGVKLDNEKREDAQPAWLSEKSTNESTENSKPLPEGETSQGGEEIPDFLRSAGWGESDGVGTDSGTGDSLPDDGIAKAEIPEWLKSQIPAGLSAEEKPVTELPANANADFPDWLTSIGTQAVSSIPSSESPGNLPVDKVASDSGSFFTAEQESSENHVREDASIPSVDNVDKESKSWLGDFTGESSNEPEEQIPATQGQPEALPDWLTMTAEETSSQNLQVPSQEPLPTNPIDSSKPEAPLANEEESITAISGDAGDGAMAAPSIQTGVSPESPEEGKGAMPLNIEDDTMAWLEGLAVKQGAKPEELLTKPEDRSEEIPDWLKQSKDEKSSIHAGEEDREILSSVSGVEEPPETIDKGKIGTVPLPSLDDSLQVRPDVPTKELNSSFPEESPTGFTNINNADNQWLEEPVIGKSETTGEAYLQTGQVLEKLPEWLQGESQPSELVPEGQSGTNIPVPQVSEVEQTTSAGEDVTITSWLKNLEDSGAEKDSVGEINHPDSQPPSAVDIPDWLKDIEKQPAKDEESKSEEPTGPRLDLPEWLTEPSVAVPEQTVPQSESGVSENRGWTQEDVEPVERPEPTYPSEWMPAENRDIPTEIATTESGVVDTKAPISPPGMKEAGILSSIPSQDKDANILADAQQFLASNYLEEAMKEYTKLIKKGRLLDEVIHDLREALYRFPVDIIVWQTLGDAYMRANRLQDALDAYTKAEELLR